VCSCHFEDGNKINGPTILPHRLNQFGTHHLTPEKKKTRKNFSKLMMSEEKEDEIFNNSEFEINTALDHDESTKSNPQGYHLFFEYYDFNILIN